MLALGPLEIVSLKKKKKECFYFLPGAYILGVLGKHLTLKKGGKFIIILHSLNNIIMDPDGKLIFRPLVFRYFCSCSEIVLHPSISSCTMI